MKPTKIERRSYAAKNHDILASYGVFQYRGINQEIRQPDSGFWFKIRNSHSTVNRQNTPQR